MYRDVALAYQAKGRLSQAVAVCSSALEIDRNNQEIEQLLRQIEAHRADEQDVRATEIRDDRYSLPSLSPGPAGSPPRRRSSNPSRGSPVPRAQPPGGPGAPRRHSRPADSAPPYRRSPPHGSAGSSVRPPGVPGPPGEARRPTPTAPQRPPTELPPEDAVSEAYGRRQSSVGDEERTPARATGPSSPPPPPADAAARRGAHSPSPPGGDDFDDAATRVADDLGFSPVELSPAISSRGPSPPGPARGAPRSDTPRSDTPPTDTPPTDSPPIDQDAPTRVAGPGEAESWAPPSGAALDHAATSVRHPGEAFGLSSGIDEGGPRLFERSFRSALDGLAPDGSAIDVPLGVFSELPSDVLDQLVRGMSLRTAEPGEILVREGEIGDACFVIASGEVRVLKREPRDPHGRPIEVARLGHGAVFGEFALLADRRRHATVEVVERAELFEIPRRLASELAASYPEVRPTLEKFYRERLLSTLLTTAPLFQPLPAERRADVLAHFYPKRSESGEAIVTEGKQAGGLYLVVLGQVEITKRVAQKRSVLLATLSEGAYFGEMSLLQGDPASASVVATGPTELAVLPAASFYEIVAEYPVLWDTMKQEAGRRDLENHRIVTGNTSMV